MCDRRIEIPSRSVQDLIEQSRQHPMCWLLPDVVLEDGLPILHGREESFKTMSHTATA